MPTVLRDNQHELLLPDASVSVVFGTEETGFLATAYPTLEAGESTANDVQRVREDGVAFGEDYLAGKSFVFEIGVLAGRNAASPHSEVTDLTNTLEGVWTDERFRERSSYYGILRSKLAGRVTRCYGRPRRYAESAGRLAHKGMIPVVADFAIADGRFYDDTEQTAAATIALPPEGGFITPFEFPLTSTAESSGQTSLTIGGTKTTWPTVEFYGPVSKPRVTIGNLVVGLRGDVPTGMKVTVDPRPWMRSVVRDDGANQAGQLSYETPRMRRMLLAPGVHPVTYEGTDATGTSWCQVRWRNARARP